MLKYCPICQHHRRSQYHKDNVNLWWFNNDNIPDMSVAISKSSLLEKTVLMRYQRRLYFLWYLIFALDALSDSCHPLSAYTSCAGRMACHCWIVISPSCASAVFSCTSHSDLCFNWSHKCLIGFKSGKLASHSMTVIPFCPRWFTIAHAVWALAVSCWRIKFCPTCWALILTSCVLPLTLVHAHTIMLPPPYAVFCWTLLTLWWVHYEWWWTHY